MRKSFSFPVNISLKDKNCLIFGLGEVGKRKLYSLIEAQAGSIIMLDLLPKSALNLDEKLFSCSNTQISFICRDFREEDLEGIFLVFACSSDKLKNRALSILCQAKNILCDNSTEPNEGNFISPALVESNPLMLSISTSGTSPLLAARLKKELEQWLKPRALLASLIGKLRPYILKLELPQNERREIFRSILDSPIQGWLLEGQFEACEHWLLNTQPFLTKNELQEVFKELKCSHHI